TDAPLREVRFDGDKRSFTFGLDAMPREAWATVEFTLDEGGQTASGTMKQMGAELPITMTRLEEGESAGPRRPQDPVTPYPYTERQVESTIPAAGAKIAGTLTIPRADEFGEGPFACALLITGSGPQDRDESILGHRPFLVLADHLTRAGFA